MCLPFCHKWELTKVEDISEESVNCGDVLKFYYVIGYVKTYTCKKCGKTKTKIKDVF